MLDQISAEKAKIGERLARLDAGARPPSLGERVLALAIGKTRQELYMRHVPAIARTMSALYYSAISAPDESRSVTASCMR
jgi:hypothetical protein